VRSDAAAPPPAPASRRTTADLKEVPAARRGTDGRDVLELRLPPGRHHILALTVGRNASVAGSTAEVRMVESVRGLTADRMHDQVRLGWIWPDGAADALISWPGGECRCSRRVYDDEGGAVITIGAAEAIIEVGAVYPQRDGSLTANGKKTALTHVTAIRKDVNVRVVISDQAITADVLTGPKGWQAPGSLDASVRSRVLDALGIEAQMVARVGPQDITPGQIRALPVQVAKGPAWLACFGPRTP
jgi:hypothetical protein